MACTVKELQSFLIKRGVVVGGQRKLELAELCEIARKLIPTVSLKIKTMLLPKNWKTGTQDLSMLPYFNVMDVFSYLLTNNSSFSQIRDYQKSEGYSLMTDCFVKHVETVTFEQPGYFAVKARVKRRTRDRDPVSGARFYFLWIILSSVGSDNRSCILSAFCCSLLQLKVLCDQNPIWYDWIDWLICSCWLVWFLK